MMVKIIKKPTTYAGESLTLLLNFAKVGVGNESVHKDTDTYICLAEAGGGVSHFSSVSSSNA